MSEYDERRGPTEQFQVDDAPRRPGSPTPSAKIRAVARYERIQLVIRVITLLFSYSVLALWIYVAIKWNDTAGSTFRSVVVDPLQEVNMWFGIPIVCAIFAIGFDTWDIIALSNPFRTRARPGILLTHEFLNILTLVFGIVFGYNSDHNQVYFDLAKSQDLRDFPFASLYLKVAYVTITFL
ncbi:hypothetical protein jhhlp_007774 [Lomentospora prolificans]|uniref:Uncharacterized protein n=1 Tax=Lomentospora prolificans TaxID=41688 RepID=A0A2N3N0I7_9PEZI|nr:hypothetical protein jhhlp_007774 [Lomentospora prolificans]